MPASSPSAAAFTVSDIRVDGLQRISAGTVFTYLPIERGDTIDAARRAMSAADPAAPLMVLAMSRDNLAAVVRRQAARSDTG